jgi:hypothetical protein
MSIAHRLLVRIIGHHKLSTKWQQLQSIRVIATNSPSIATKQQQIDKCYNRLDLTFENTEEAFKVSMCI